MRLREQQDLTGAPLAALLPRLDAAAGGCAGGAGERPGDQEHGDSAATIAAEPRNLSRRRRSAEPSRRTCSAIRRSAGKRRSPNARRRAGTRCASPRRSWTPSWPATANCWWPGGACESRVEELAALREFVGRWKAEWRAVEKSSLTRSAAGARDEPTGRRLAPRPRAPRLPRRAAQVARPRRRQPAPDGKGSGTFGRRAWRADGRVLEGGGRRHRRRGAPRAHAALRRGLSGAGPHGARPGAGGRQGGGAGRSRAATWSWIGRCWRG